MVTKDIKEGTEVEFVPNLETYTIASEVGNSNEVFIRDSRNNGKWANIKNIQEIKSP